MLAWCAYVSETIARCRMIRHTPNQPRCQSVEREEKGPRVVEHSHEPLVETPGVSVMPWLVTVAVTWGYGASIPYLMRHRSGSVQVPSINVETVRPRGICRLRPTIIKCRRFRHTAPRLSWSRFLPGRKRDDRPQMEACGYWRLGMRCVFLRSLGLGNQLCGVSPLQYIFVPPQLTGVD